MSRLRFRRDETGSAAVEFALTGPIMIVLLAGLVVYGGWLWTAQGVQHLAAEAARAAVAGVDAGEREALARQAAADGARAAMGLNPAKANVGVTSGPDTIRVTVDYDASGEPILALAGLIPSPPTLIRREAVVRVGGY